MIPLLLFILATDNIIEQPKPPQPVGPMIMIFEVSERVRWEV